MTISSATARVSFACNGSTNVFPISMQAYLATDFLVIHDSGTSGTALVLNSDYTLTTSGTLQPTLWTLQSTFVYPTGDTLLVILNPTQTQLTQYVQGQAFPSPAVQANFDRLTQMVLRLQDQISRTLRAPDSDLNAWPVLPGATARANTFPIFDGNGLPAIGALTSTPLTAALVGQFFYPTLASESGVVNNLYPYGYFRRFGAQGKGWLADDTIAVRNCINSSVNVYGSAGDVYGVQAVVFPDNGVFSFFDGNSCGFQGIATAATNGPLILIQCSSSTVIRNYYVVGVGNGSTVPSPNPNYVCAVQEYNGVKGSQFKTFEGPLLLCWNRGYVYGALPGQTPTGGPQSENTISGLKCIGVANPFYSNAQSGFVYLIAPILNVSSTLWTSPFPATTPRMLECVSGFVEVQGGEMEYAVQATGYAADLQSCTLIGVNIETAAPVQIIGDGVQITGGQLFNTQSNQSAFKVAAGVTGTLTLNGPLLLERAAGLGATAMVPMIDSTAAPSFNVLLQGTSSTEWPWNMQGQDIRLVAGGKPVYHGHRMNITAADGNWFTINTSPFDSLLPNQSFDQYGYTTNGWFLTTDFGAGTTMTATSNPGPTGYLAAQITLHATGQAVATNVNTSSLSTIQNTALHVKPGDLCWGDGWFDTAFGSAGSFIARGFNLSGALVGDTTIADPVALGTGAWKFISAPFVVPAGVAYIGVGPKGIASDVQATNVRIRRA